MPEHSLDTGWSDLGPAPLVISLMGSGKAAYVAAPSRPDAALPTSALLSLGDAMLITGEGLRVFARAETGGSRQATVLAQSPSEYLAAPAVFDVSSQLGRLLLAGLRSPAVAWSPVAVNVIGQADAYQELFAAGTAENGGYIVNTSAPASASASAPLWVDPTGATGAQRSRAAMPVYPAFDGGSAPGGWRVPPTTRAVTIMGPAGATFQAAHG